MSKHTPLAKTVLISMLDSPNVAPEHIAARTVWIIIPGLGEPRIHDKLSWLRENVARIAASRGPWTVRMRIYCYGQEPLPAEELPDASILPIEFVYEKGILFQYLYKHITPAAVAACAAYVFFLLDDVRMSKNFSLEQMLTLYSRVQCDLLEAALTRASPTPWWMIMHQDDQSLRRGFEGRRTNFVEFFATVLSVDAYQRYYNTCLSENSAWGWGIDMMLDSLGFRLFLWDACPVTHEIFSTSYKECPEKDPKVEAATTMAMLESRGGKPISSWNIYEYL